jgi:hypothetical protein
LFRSGLLLSFQHDSLTMIISRGRDRHDLSWVEKPIVWPRV